MSVKVVLVDINPKMVKAWRDTFEENPEVEIVQGSMLDQRVDAWVSPTNSYGNMDGGLDAVIKNNLGQKIEQAVKKCIADRFGSTLPVGHATCVPTGRQKPGYLISTPTMVKSSEDISDSLNVALACAAAFQAVHMQNAKDANSIQSVALPGLGANTGRVPAEICADLMWTAYNMFREHAFSDFKEMRKALEEELGDLGPAEAKPLKMAAVAAAAGGASKAAKSGAKPSQKASDEDFDDHDDMEDDDDFDDSEGGESDDEEDEDDDDFDDHE